MNAHNKMWQKQHRNISYVVSEQENQQYLKNSPRGRSQGWGKKKKKKKGLIMSVHSPSMYFKATDVTVNTQKILKVIKHFQICQ
jgi:hypothetical protein